MSMSALQQKLPTIKWRIRYSLAAVYNTHIRLGCRALRRLANVLFCSAALLIISPGKGEGASAGGSEALAKETTE